MFSSATPCYPWPWSPSSMGHGVLRHQTMEPGRYRTVFGRLVNVGGGIFTELVHVRRFLMTRSAIWSIPP